MVRTSLLSALTPCVLPTHPSLQGARPQGFGRAPLLPFLLPSNKVGHSAWFQGTVPQCNLMYLFGLLRPLLQHTDSLVLACGI